MNYKSNNYYPVETINHNNIERINYTYNPYVTNEELHLTKEIEFLYSSPLVYVLFYIFIYIICFTIITSYFEFLDLFDLIWIDYI